MQTVGGFIMNPTGKPVLNTGSQLNKAQNSKAVIGFGQMLKNVVNQVASQDKALAKQQGSLTEPLLPELVEEAAELLKELEAQLNELLQALPKDKLAEGVKKGDVAGNYEVEDAMFQLIKQLQELLELLFSGQGYKPNDGEATGSFQAILEGLEKPQGEIGSGGQEKTKSLELLIGLKEILREIRPLLTKVQHHFLPGDAELKQIKEKLDNLVNNTAGVEETDKALHVKEPRGQQSEEVGTARSVHSGLQDSQRNSAKVSSELEVDTNPKEADKGALKALGEVNAKLKEVLGKVKGALEGRETAAQSSDAGAKLNFDGQPSIAVHQQPVTESLTQSLSQGQSVFSKPEPGRVFQSILSMISEKAQLIQTPEHSEFNIQLKPDFLGKLQLKISVENGLVTAKFAAETQQVKEILESNLSSLKQSLLEQGVKVEQLEVSLGQKEFQSNDQGLRHWQQQPARRRYPIMEGLVERVESPAVKAYLMDDSTIDYTV